MPKTSRISGLPLAPLSCEIRCRQAVAELGVTNLTERPGSFDQRPGVGIGKQRLKHEAIQAMAASTGAIGAEDGRTGKREIADRIERFVAHELI